MGRLRMLLPIPRKNRTVRTIHSYTQPANSTRFSFSISPAHTSILDFLTIFSTNLCHPCAPHERARAVTYNTDPYCTLSVTASHPGNNSVRHFYTTSLGSLFPPPFKSDKILKSFSKLKNPIFFVAGIPKHTTPNGS